MIREAELDETKRAIIRAMADCDLRISTAARVLHFHRNTVCYHLDRIREITGLDPRRFYDLVVLVGEMEQGQNFVQ